MLDQLHSLEMDGMRWLHVRLASPSLDRFFLWCDHLDSFPIYVILFCTLVFIGRLWHHRISLLGMTCFYGLGFFVNHYLKMFFCSVRPCCLQPDLSLICYTTYSLPSGTAQGWTLFVCFVWFLTRCFFWRWISLFFGLIACSARIYLGVHYFSDIIAGVICGLLWFCCFYFLNKRLCK